MKDLFSLPYFYLRAQWFHRKEEKKVRQFLYSDKKFQAIDQAILRSPNPYKLSRAFPYGETPLTGFKTIADKCRLTPEDHLYELGCGRGRGALFLAHTYGCQVTAIDWEPKFIEHAQKVVEDFQVKNIQFLCQDYRTLDFSKATAVYLYGTCLDDTSTNQVSASLKAACPRARVISVSQPLPDFSHTEEFSFDFPWGRGEVYFTL